MGEVTVATLMIVVMFVGVYPDRQGAPIVCGTLIVSLAVGAAAGYATKRWGHIGVLLIGAWLGGLLGSVVYSCLIRMITEESPMIFLWLSIISFSLIVSYLSQVYFQVAVIVGSAVIGSFFFFRVSLLIFPSHHIIGDL